MTFKDMNLKKKVLGQPWDMKNHTHRTPLPKGGSMGSLGQRTFVYIQRGQMSQTERGSQFQLKPTGEQTMYSCKACGAEIEEYYARNSRDSNLIESWAECPIHDQVNIGTGFSLEWEREQTQPCCK